MTLSSCHSWLSLIYIYRLRSDLGSANGPLARGKEQLDGKGKSVSYQSIALDISGVGGYHPVGCLRDLGRCVRSFHSQSPLAADTILLGIAPYHPFLGGVDRGHARSFCDPLRGRWIIPCCHRSLYKGAVGLSFGNPGCESLVLCGIASLLNRDIEPGLLGTGLTMDSHRFLDSHRPLIGGCPSSSTN